MLRKFSIVLFALVLGLFGFGGLASAGPGANYPTEGEVSVSISGDGITIVAGRITVQVGQPFTFSGQGFDALEGIGISIDGPSGLRSSAGLSELLAAAPEGVTAEADGTFATEITFSNVGVATLTATGLSSGKSASLTVYVVGAGSSGGSTGTTVAAVGTGSSGTGAGSGGSSSDGGGGLAYTGASIAGPLAIGIVALFAGLALLFFGTRGVRRRKSARLS